jgi:hypothetical protein
MRFDDAWLRQQVQKPGYRVVGATPTRSHEVAQGWHHPLQQGAQEVIPEGTFMGQIRRLALDNGWLFHHVLDSRGCEPGFPDICCVKPGHPVILAELKTQTGKLTREQALWLEFLGKATGLHTALWRPSDFPALAQLLTRS